MTASGAVVPGTNTAHVAKEAGWLWQACQETPGVVLSEVQSLDKKCKICQEHLSTSLLNIAEDLNGSPMAV